MHPSTLVLIFLAFGFAGCASWFGRACGNGAYNETLREESQDWRHTGEVDELRQAAIQGLLASHGHFAPDGYFDAQNICQFDVVGNLWEFRIVERRGGLEQTVREQVAESSPMAQALVVVEAISIVEPEEGARIKALATANGERARQNATARCNRCWDAATSDPD